MLFFDFDAVAVATCDELEVAPSLFLGLLEPGLELCLRAAHVVDGAVEGVVAPAARLVSNENVHKQNENVKNMKAVYNEIVQKKKKKKKSAGFRRLEDARFLGLVEIESGREG